MGSELVHSSVGLIIEMRYKLQFARCTFDLRTNHNARNAQHRTVTTIPSWVEEGNILCSYVFAEQSLEER
jgi:hypothetical protein